MKKWKLFAGVALVFVLGVAAGSLGTGIYHKYRFDRHKGDLSAKKAFILKKFSQELDLTEKQEDEFKRLIDQMGDKLEDHFRKTHSEIGKIIEPGFSQMRRTLSPDQQKKFDKLIEKFRRHKKSKSKFGPPRPR
jgi:Spy/CpxP family protein refolding chaperone